MIKVKLLLITGVALLGLSSSLQATECNGMFMYTDPEEALTAVVHATINCCAGSYLTLYYIPTGESETIWIDEHGSNSSCNQQ